jgi:hypothetical protein
MNCPQHSSTVHTERLGDELCLYDWKRRRVHALNSTAAFVWERCDGTASPAAIATALEQELAVPPAEAEALVTLALHQLGEAGLLASPFKAMPNRPLPPRRQLLRWGVAAGLLPVIHSLVAPEPLAAQSPVVDDDDGGDEDDGGDS